MRPRDGAEPGGGGETVGRDPKGPRDPGRFAVTQAPALERRAGGSRARAKSAHLDAPRCPDVQTPSR